MPTNTSDDLVLFEDVRLVKSTAPALLCRIGKRTVWLPRNHISGKLRRRGDRGQLFIRRWVARDRHLIDGHGAAIVSLAQSISRTPLASRLHLVREDRITLHAK